MNKFIKNLILFVLMLSMILGLGITTYADEPADGSQFKVIIDNKIVNFTDELGYPYISETNRTMVPLRIIIEDMGYDVEWEESTQKALISSEEINVEIQVGKDTAVVNGVIVPIDFQDGRFADTKAVLVPVKGSSRTYVPLRFVSQAMGAEVKYEQKNGVHCIEINTGRELKDETIKSEENLEVHFIDVGQGDAILIKQNGYNMLIDAGDNKYEQIVVDYLKENGITRLDYVIGTHPHADHIGGLDAVINTFDIGKVIMPNIIHTTKTFEDVLIAIENKGLKITTPNIGDSYELGNANFEILAPKSKSYTELNNYSVVIRMICGKTSFLFAGDAEDISEKEMLDSGRNLKADVLKVGHHGSDTSTTAVFLDAVSPAYAVIQVGKDNKYGHPTTEIINRLEERNIKIYRNDLDGNIIAISDGENIEFNTEANLYKIDILKNIMSEIKIVEKDIMPGI